MARALAAVVATAPLWLILPRLVRGERRAYAWTTLATVPYLVLGVTETVANPAARLWAMACVSVSFALFGLAVAYVRAAARAGRN